MKQLILLIICLQANFLFAQEVDKELLTNEANQFVATANKVLVKDGNFPKAEGEYRKAIAKNPENTVAKYNLGNAYYNSAKFDEANQRYTQASKIATSKEEKHKAFHNQGNTFMEQKKYKEAVESYKNALRNNPTDNQTRYNLALAKKMLEKQQQDQKNDDKNKDDKDKDQDKDNKDQKEGDDKKDKKGDDGDKKENEGKDDKDKGDENKDKGDKGEDKEDKSKGDQEKKDGEKGEDKPKDQAPPKQVQQGQLSPEQVKSLLEAMNNQEKKVQDKMNAKKAQGSKVRTDKDW